MCETTAGIHAVDEMMLETVNLFVFRIQEVLRLYLVLYIHPPTHEYNGL